MVTEIPRFSVLSLLAGLLEEQAPSPFSLSFRELRSAVSGERGDKWKHQPGAAPGSASSPMTIHPRSTSVLPRLALSTLGTVSLNFCPLTFEKQPAIHANHGKDSALNYIF